MGAYWRVLQEEARVEAARREGRREGPPATGTAGPFAAGTVGLFAAAAPGLLVATAPGLLAAAGESPNVAAIAALGADIAGPEQQGKQQPGFK
ncbi:hypothetical protein DL768_005728 [Monosporascus sp. mg162]|nr:hypothetical protein DL768_005728 [Monosporascus sp. mg162]